MCEILKQLPTEACGSWFIMKVHVEPEKPALLLVLRLVEDLAHSIATGKLNTELSKATVLNGRKVHTRMREHKFYKCYTFAQRPRKLCRHNINGPSTKLISRIIPKKRACTSTT